MGRDIAPAANDVTESVSELARSSTERRVRADRLFQEIYPDLRRLAGGMMRHERIGHTLEPTALVHEAYMKLVDQSRVDWRGRSHFFAVGARAMRRMLVDHARKKRAGKRGGGLRNVTLADSLHASDASLPPEELLSLHDALTDLEELDERAASVVELRFFGGLDMKEIAEVLSVSKRTVESDWAHARAWLRRELARESAKSAE